MKFGKEFLRVIEETQPEFRDKFLCYKQLKKHLKQLPDTSADPAGPPAEGAHKRELTPAEREFVRALNAELAKFNEFFMEKEEELVMMDKALGDRGAALLAAPGATSAQLASHCHAVARFHGELVLLEHWCSLNYAALVKILKKHDKRSSLSLRLPILVNVLRQPFYSTEIITRLVKGAEARFKALSLRLAAAGALAQQQAQQQQQPQQQAAAPAAGGAAGAGAGAAAAPPPAGAPGEAAAAAAAAADDAAAAAPLPPLMQYPAWGGPAAAAGAGPGGAGGGGAHADEEASMLARTRAALQCWETLRKSQSLGPAPAQPAQPAPAPAPAPEPAPAVAAPSPAPPSSPAAARGAGAGTSTDSSDDEGATAAAAAAAAAPAPGAEAAADGGEAARAGKRHKA